MELGLQNSVIFIAGSSKGIGLGIAQSFLKEGAKVCVSGRDRSRLDKVHSELVSKYSEHRVVSICDDLSSEDTILAALKVVRDRWGSIDCVVGNIGDGNEGPSLPTSRKQVEASFGNNLLPSLLLATNSYPFVKESQNASIILIGSIAGHESMRAPLGYSIHKAALQAACKKLADQFGSDGIRVNMVCPGNILYKGGRWEQKLSENRGAIEKYIQDTVPLQKFGAPEDVASATLFLASNEAKFITGSVLMVDGGQTRSF